MPRMREPFSVQIPADSPYGVLFALARASSGVRNVSTDKTGPKISSRAIRIDCDTSVNTVGGKKNPLSGTGHGDVQRCAPSASPAADSSVILESCSAELIAPISVFLSIGSPSRNVAMRSRSLDITSSSTDSCTNRRDPAQHTCPWLKKIPLTIPSTAWSIGASSNTMFAALPPSSSVTFLPVPANDCWIFLPTAVEPVNATLSMPGWFTR